MLSLMDHTRTHTELRIQVAFIQSLGMQIVITNFFTPNTPGADKEFYEGDQNIKREGPGPEVAKEMFSVLKLVTYLTTVSHISDDFAECLSLCTPFSPLNKEHIYVHIHTYLNSIKLRKLCMYHTHIHYTPRYKRVT